MNSGGRRAGIGAVFQKSLWLESGIIRTGMCDITIWCWLADHSASPIYHDLNEECMTEYCDVCDIAYYDHYAAGVQIFELYYHISLLAIDTIS